ncbi:hypothetical protein Glove_94g51 [Diversispora epigaea]|uniref:Uncharacterized protein n=1 Tax=Diversispora epigaea TaxID=1348612 RepID=A0A397J537_9GLOM|nr:hypothetical protein Glove_94g51 [Diversispora epigaea]
MYSLVSLVFLKVSIIGADFTDLTSTTPTSKSSQIKSQTYSTLHDPESASQTKTSSQGTLLITIVFLVYLMVDVLTENLSLMIKDIKSNHHPLRSLPRKLEARIVVVVEMVFCYLTNLSRSYEIKNRYVRLTLDELKHDDDIKIQKERTFDNKEIVYVISRMTQYGLFCRIKLNSVEFLNENYHYAFLEGDMIRIMLWKRVEDRLQGKNTN